MFKKISFLLLPLCLPGIVHAGMMGALEACKYFVSLSAGSSWANAGGAQIIALEPDVVKAYVPQNFSSSLLMGNAEVFVGIQKSFFPYIQTQYGVNAYFSSHEKLNGYIFEDASSNFNNYQYQYKINHTNIGLKTKWIAENAFNVNPYVTGSIGVGINKSYGYQVSQNIFQEIPAPLFQSNTNVTFSYSLSAGVQRTFSQHVTVGIDYLFVAWGNSALARAPGQTVGAGLSLSGLYTQGIELAVSYFL